MAASTHRDTNPIPKTDLPEDLGSDSSSVTSLKIVVEPSCGLYESKSGTGLPVALS